MSKELTHWKKFHNPDYIGAYAFQPDEEKVATIHSVQVEEVAGTGGKKEECMVVRFVEKDMKPLICNVTNSKAIEKALGSGYIENWIGKPIQLYVTEVSAFGATVDAVRVRPKQPKLTLPTLTETHKQFDTIVSKLANNETTLETVRKHFVVSEQVGSKLMELAMQQAPIGGSDAE
jgi:hypothetical protein